MIVFRIAILTGLCLISTLGLSQEQDKPTTSPTIDLREAQWGEGQAHSLAGDWGFAWHKLVSPYEKPSQEEWYTMPVPGAWDNQELNPGYPPMGYASYALRIVVPRELTHTYIAIPDMASAYKLWINGDPLPGNGTIATNAQAEDPAYLPKVVKAFPKDGVLELLLQTSNYHYQWGGLWYAPKITDESGVFAIREFPIIKASIASTLLISTGLLALILFLSRKEDKKVLYFSLLCFAVGIRRLVIDERVLYMLDWFNWDTLQFIENLGIYLLLPLFTSYFYHWFPKETNKKLLTVSWIASAPFCLAAVFLEVHTYTKLNIPFQLLILFAIPYIFFAYHKALKAKRTGAKMFGFSLLIFALAVINDALNYSYIVDTPNLIHYGVIAFVLFQLSALIRRYLQNFKTIEAMSTELQARNNELIQLDEFKDEFLATTSHELRTPLHGIAGLAQLLREESATFSPPQKHKIDLIESTSKRLGNLVNDILDFSSIKHGKLALHKAPILFKPLAENIIQTLKPLTKGKNLVLDSTIDHDVAYVMADEFRLQQILFNLIGNAIKFTEQGHISLRAKQQNGQLTIFIDDTGSGIPEDKIDILFQPFEQYVKDGQKQIASTGLGLSITKQLIQLHEGELRLRSAVGEGTQVEFTLPACAEPTTLPPTPLSERPAQTSSEYFEQELAQVTQAPKEPREEAPGFAVPRDDSALVYYADDEAVNRELVHSQLQKAGYQIETFSNASELLAQVQVKAPELILLDLMMPGMDGLEACKELRKQFNSYQLPVMMLTARYQVADIIDALGAGANDYLIKPYHEKELLARLYSQLSVRRLWYASEENEKLKSEISRREVMELELSKANIRLQQVLDISDENLLLLNDEFDIVFVNQQACTLLGNDSEKLLGETLASLIEPSSLRNFRTLANKNENEFELTVSTHKAGQQLTLAVNPFEENHESYFAIILTDTKTRAKTKTQDLLKHLTQELVENRQRIDQIESALSQVALEEDSTAPGISDHASPEKTDTTEQAKELVVRTLRTALLTWERYTHQSKADLAEQSRCWRVYIDGTTAKTRTLDKYLSVKTLPAKPRWRAVIKTANYVIDHCQLSQEDSDELIKLIDSLDLAYS